MKLSFGIRSTVIFFTLFVVLITTVVIFTFNYWFLSRETIKNGLLDLSITNEISSVRFIDALHTVKQDVKFLAKTPAIRGIIRAAKNDGIDPLDQSSQELWQARLSQNFLALLRANPHYLQIRFIGIKDNAKELVSVQRYNNHTIVTPKQQLQEQNDATYFQESINLPNSYLYISKIEFQKNNSDYIPTIKVAIPIYSAANEIFGIIIINDNLQYTLESLMPTYEKTNFFMINEQNHFIHHSKQKYIHGLDLNKDISLSSFFPDITKPFVDQMDLELSGIFKDSNNVKKAVALKKHFLENNNYILFVSTMDYHLLYQHLQQVVKRLILYILLAIPILILASLKLANSLVKPLTSVIQSINKFTHSKEKIELKTDQKGEVGLLVNTFNRMQTEVIARTELLQQREQRLSAMINGALDAIITINQSGIILSFNMAAEKMFDYQHQFVIGKNVSILMPEPFNLKHDDYIARYLKTKEKYVIDTVRELLARKSNGEVFPIELSVSSIQEDGKYIFQGMIRDISARKKTEKLKNEFISTVSHELRTPITSIKGGLGLAMTNKLDEEKSNKILKLAYDNATRLEHLVNDLLDFDKLQAGELKFNFKDCHLSNILKQSVELNKHYAKKYNVSFVIKEIPDVTLSLDYLRISQVMSNLLSNAAKFSNAGDHIEISAHELDNYYRIEVTDHGEGIPDEYKEIIFDRFTQVDSSDTRQQGGTGIGLHLSKLIIEKHNGKINFRSTVGKGSTFYFDLPKL